MQGWLRGGLVRPGTQTPWRTRARLPWPCPVPPPPPRSPHRDLLQPRVLTRRRMPHRWLAQHSQLSRNSSSTRARCRPGTRAGTSRPAFLPGAASAYEVWSRLDLLCIVSLAVGSISPMMRATLIWRARWRCSFWRSCVRRRGKSLPLSLMKAVRKVGLRKSALVRTYGCARWKGVEWGRGGAEGDEEGGGCGRSRHWPGPGVRGRCGWSGGRIGGQLECQGQHTACHPLTELSRLCSARGSPRPRLAAVSAEESGAGHAHRQSGAHNKI